MLTEHAQFTIDEEQNSLIVWAEKKYHEAIDTARGVSFASAGIHPISFWR